MDGLPGGPEAARLDHGDHDTLEPSVAMKGGWQIVSVPGIDLVEAGFVRQQALAGQLSTPALMVWRSRPALLVGRLETRLPHFQDAAAELQASGWPVVGLRSQPTPKAWRTGAATRYSNSGKIRRAPRPSPTHLPCKASNRRTNCPARPAARCEPSA